MTLNLNKTMWLHTIVIFSWMEAKDRQCTKLGMPKFACETVGDILAGKLCAQILFLLSVWGTQLILHGFPPKFG